MKSYSPTASLAHAQSMLLLGDTLKLYNNTKLSLLLLTKCVLRVATMNHLWRRKCMYEKNLRPMITQHMYTQSVVSVRSL